jgi:ABC-type transporter Mla subunit MlaD
MNVWQAYEELKSALGPEASQKVALVLDALIQEHVRTEVREATDPLQVTLRQLAAAQARTEEQLNRLSQRVEELAEAQKRTEQRVAELAEAQKRTEERLEALGRRVDELAEAQKRTEQRVEELAEAQRRTEQRVEALARRMEELTGRVEELADRLGETNRQLGGLAATVGYTLENAAYRALPGLLARDHGVRLVEGLRRDFVLDAGGQAWEVNILGRAEVSGQVVWVVGESKVQLSRNDVDRFVRRRLERLEPVLGRVLPVLVAHMVSEPGVREYARSQGVSVYLSYEFEG